MDEATGSGCEDDNKDDSPCASDRSCPSGSSANESVGNPDECSSSSVASAEDSPSTSASEKPLEQPEGAGRDLQGEVCTGGQAEILSEENSKMAEAPKEVAQGKNAVAQAQKEGQENVPAKAQETNQSQSTVSMKSTKCGVSSAAFRAEEANKLQQCSFSHWIDESQTDTWQQRVPILLFYGSLHIITVKDLLG